MNIGQYREFHFSLNLLAAKERKEHQRIQIKSFLRGPMGGSAARIHKLARGGAACLGGTEDPAYQVYRPRAMVGALTATVFTRLAPRRCLNRQARRLPLRARRTTFDGNFEIWQHPGSPENAGG